MRKIFKNTIFIALIALLALQGCKDSYYDELIDNPNQVYEASLPSLLSTSTFKMGRNNYTVGGTTSYFAQYLAGVSANGLTDTYQYIDYSGTWDAIYFALADANELKKLAVKMNANEYIGAANIMLAYNLNLANDLWGSVPFSKAFDPTNVRPDYDSDKDVYTQSLALINEAIVELTKPTVAFRLDVTNDLIYGKTGNQKANWLKLAHAMKARMLLKASKTSDYNAADVLTATSNSFTSNAEDAGMATFLLRNFWAGVAVSNAAQSLDGWLSQHLINQLQTTGPDFKDPRLYKITDTAKGGVFIGTINGAGNAGSAGNTVKDECYVSRNSPWTNDTAPILIITYAEVKFIEAEAAFATDKTRAFNAYKEGITANMQKLLVSATDINAYLSNSSKVAQAEADLTLAMIRKEKYIALYLNPEAWNDVRRYEYAGYTLPQFETLGGFIRRVGYPQAERNKNGSNVPADLDRKTRLWWDVEATP